MKTGSLFWQLFKQLPETLFALLDRPLTQVADYRFEAVEIKKSYRLDGIFLPATTDLPLYFVEVQFQHSPCFYANLFAKVFSHLEVNDPNQDWMAIALFPDRATEGDPQRPYQVLISSRHVRRFYLDDLKVKGAAAPGLKLLQLVAASESETPKLVSKILLAARREPDCERMKLIVELVEEILLRRFTQLTREEMRRMFQLDDIRNSRVWQEAHEEGEADKLRELIKRLKSKGKTLKEIADLFEMPVSEVRRLAKEGNLT